MRVHTLLCHLGVLYPYRSLSQRDSKRKAWPSGVKAQPSQAEPSRAEPVSRVRLGAGRLTWHSAQLPKSTPRTAPLPNFHPQQPAASPGPRPRPVLSARLPASQVCRPELLPRAQTPCTPTRPAPLLLLSSTVTGLFERLGPAVAKAAPDLCSACLTITILIKPTPYR